MSQTAPNFSENAVTQPTKPKSLKQLDALNILKADLAKAREEKKALKASGGKPAKQLAAVGSNGDGEE